MIVDIHAHILGEAFLSELADEGAFGIAHGANGAYVFPGYGPLDRWLYDIDARIESLSARDIDLQLVAPPPRRPAWSRTPPGRRMWNSPAASIDKPPMP